MTPQEQQMLQGLTDRVNGTQVQDKDPEAEQFLGQTLGRNPDALYILAQTVLVQQYALDQAKRQLDQLRQQQNQASQQQPQKHTSFLGNLLGRHDDPEPAPAPPPQQQGYGQQQYQPVPSYNPPPPMSMQPMGYGAPQIGVPGGQGGGFLRSALQTATGVAAGAIAFEGIESLMHGFGGGGREFGGGFGGGGFSDGGQPREEVINNYYGGDSAGNQDRGADSLGAEAGRESGLSSDLEDRRDDNRAGFADTGSDSGVDDASSDDSSAFDDNSGTDDSGGFDSGGDDTNY